MHSPWSIRTECTGPVQFYHQFRETVCRYRNERWRVTLYIMHLLLITLWKAELWQYTATGCEHSCSCSAWLCWVKLWMWLLFGLRLQLWFTLWCYGYACSSCAVADLYCLHYISRESIIKPHRIWTRVASIRYERWVTNKTTGAQEYCSFNRTHTHTYTTLQVVSVTPIMNQSTATIKVTATAKKQKILCIAYISLFHTGAWAALAEGAPWLQPVEVKYIIWGQ